MDWTLEDLGRAFAPVEEIGKKELTIPVGSTTITLRALLPEEESKIQKEAATSDTTENGITEITDALEYIDRFKVAAISHAIVAVGRNDFRNVQYVETGDVLDQGQKVKIPLHQAMRQMVLRWTGPTRTQIFKNYSDLLTEVEKDAETAIVYEPSDLETELEKAKAKVAKIEADLERRKKPASVGIVASQIHAIAKGAKGEEEIPEPEVSDQEPEIVVQAPPPVAQRPVVRTPPVYPVQPQAPQPRVPARPVMAPPPVRGNPNPESPIPDAWEDIQDSFASADDPKVVEAENRRLFEEQRRQAQGLPQAPNPQAYSVIDAARQQYGFRRPPHAAAAETAALIQQETAEIPDEFVATGRAPVEIISRRPEPSPVTIPVKDSRNPRFTQRKV